MPLQKQLTPTVEGEEEEEEAEKSIFQRLIDSVRKGHFLLLSQTERARVSDMRPADNCVNK